MTDHVEDKQNPIESAAPKEENPQENGSTPHPETAPLPPKVEIVHRGMAIIVLLTGVCLLGFLITAWQLGRVSADLRQVRKDLAGLQAKVVAGIDQPIQQGIARIEEVLAKETSFLADSQIEFLKYQDHKIEISLSATPREYQENQQLSFVLMGDNGEEMTVPAANTTTTTYTATAKIPFWQTMKVKVILEQGNSKLSYVMPQSTYPQEMFTLSIDANFFGGEFFVNGNKGEKKLNTEFEYNISAYTPVIDNGILNKMTECNLIVERDSEKIHTQKLEVKASGVDNMYRVENSVIKQSFPAEPGNVFDFIAEIKDSSGFTYRKIINRVVIGNNGIPNEEYIDKPVKITEE